MSKAVMISIQPKWCEKIANGIKTIEIRKTRPKLEPPFKCYIYCTANRSHFSVGGGLYFGADELYRNAKREIKYGTSVELMCCDNYDETYFLNRKVIGEFTCNRISEYEAEFHKGNDHYQNIKEVFPDPDLDDPDRDLADFCILTANDDDNPDDCEFCKQTCLTFEEVKAYIGGDGFMAFYGWHISDLVIYDTPKELSEFGIVDNDAVKKCNHRFRVGQPEYKTANGGWINGTYCCTKESSYDPDLCTKCKTKKLERPPQSWCYVEEVQA